MPHTDVLPSILAVAAFLPPAFYLWSVTSFARRAEPPAAVIGTLVLGALGAFLLNLVIAPIAGSLYWANDGAMVTSLRTLALVSAPEEAVKFLVLAAFAQRFIERDHPMAGIVYGAAVGFGFVAVENVGYLLVNLDRWTSVTFVRSVVTVPVHGVLGIIAGIYVARARLGSGMPGIDGALYRARSYAAGLLIPIVLHAIYDLPFALTRAYDAPSEQTLTLLKAVGLAIGAGIAAIGASATFRAASTQDPAFEPRCLSPHLLRSPWRLHICASLSGLLGLLMIAAEIAALQYGAPGTARRSVLLVIAVALLALAAFLHARAARR